MSIDSNRKGLKRYSPEYEQEIFDFQREAYPDRSPDVIPDRWRWMFLQSAKSEQCEPLVWLYFRKGELVAHQGGIPVRLTVKQRTIRTCWFVETMVLDRARRGPVGATLVAKALEDAPFNLSLGQSPLMREMQYRLGWKQIGALHTYVLPLDAEAILAGRKLIERSALAAYLRFQRVRRRMYRNFNDSADVEFSPVEIFGSEHNELWARTSRWYPCAVVRDADFLNWKFVAQPGQRFVCFQVMKRGVLSAIVVAVKRPAREPYSYARLEVCDVVVDPGDGGLIGAIVRKLAEFASSLQCASIFFNVRHHQLEKSLARNGFLKRQSTRWLLLATAGLDVRERESVESIENWLLTSADSDIDRP